MTENFLIFQCQNSFDLLGEVSLQMCCLDESVALPRWFLGILWLMRHIMEAIARGLPLIH
jgi:hypothetical protein